MTRSLAVLLLWYIRANPPSLDKPSHSQGIAEPDAILLARIVKFVGSEIPHEIVRKRKIRLMDFIRFQSVEA